MAVVSEEIRIDIASLRTELWASLATAHSAQQIVSAWAIKMQQALNAQWTAIWTNDSEDGPILQAYIDRQSSDDDSLSRSVSLQDSVERACAITCH